MQIRSNGWPSSGSSTPIRSLSIRARPARSRISRPCSGSLSRNLAKAHSPESLIDSATIRTFDPSNRRTTSSNWPTRFSRNTVNCRRVGQFLARAVAYPTSTPSPASPRLTSGTPRGFERLDFEGLGRRNFATSTEKRIESERRPGQRSCGTGCGGTQTERSRGAGHG